jgi:plasmid stability protein
LLSTITLREERQCLSCLVRDLDAATVERLKLRAQRHGRSLQGEVKAILQAAATLSMDEAHDVAAQWQRKLAGRAYRDSAEGLAEDRAR